MTPPRSESVPPPAALARVVGLGGAVRLGLGSILGTGLFVSLGLAAGVAGPAVLLALAAAAAVAACNGLSSAQLAAAHPVSGGTYEYGHRYLTPTLGFVAGWTFLCAKSASAATAALGGAGYLVGVLALDADRWTLPLALALVATLTVLVAGGLRRSDRANTWIVGATLLGLFALVVLGLPTALARADEHLQLGVGGVGAARLLEATALAFVAYTGYGRVATLGEEVRAPARTIPRAVVATLAVTLVVYLAVAVVAVGVLGAPALAAAARADAAPLEAVARALGRPWLALVVAAAAVTAMTGVLLNLLLGLSRVLLALARRGDAPAGLAAVAPGGSPRRAVLATGVAVAALTLVGDVGLTWSFSAFTVLVYYAVTNLAALAQPPGERRFPRVVPALGLVACLGLAPFVERPAWVAGLALLALGLGARALARRFLPSSPPARP